MKKKKKYKYISNVRARKIIINFPYTPATHCAEKSMRNDRAQTRAYCVTLVLHYLFKCNSLRAF